MDESYWEKPSEFKPERFLSDDGTQIIQHENFIPFGETSDNVFKLTRNQQINSRLRQATMHRREFGQIESLSVFHNDSSCI